MRKITFITLSIAVLMAFASCKKTELTGSKAMYEGTWTSYTTTLTLNSNGRGSYNYDDGVTTKYINNGRLIIEGSTLKIKMMVKKVYHIDVPPHSYSSGYGYDVTTMTLDGEEFIKQ
jgi:hypothetical protein